MTTKYKVLFNLLVAFCAFFIILSGIFIYKFVTYKSQIVQSGNGILVVKVIDTEDEKNEDKLNFTQYFLNTGGKSAYEILNGNTKEHKYGFSKTFLNSIDGVSYTNDYFFALESPTNCNDGGENFCMVGASDIVVTETVLQIVVTKIANA